MPDQYRIVVSCLHMVKKGDLTPVNKVRLEIQLIHLLRLLMETDPGDVNTRPDCCSQRAFDDILELSSQTGRPRCSALLVGDLMERVGDMIATLSLNSGTRAPNAFLTGSCRVD